MGFRLSNVIGAPFRDYVTDQLQMRLNKGITGQAPNYNRSPEEILYLANKTSWVRVCSSANVSDDYINILGSYYGAEEAAFNPPDDTPLATRWILQAGTSINQLTDVPNAPGEFTAGVQLREGLGYDGSYGLGGITEQGYRPMPGLESVTIETAGRLGSLRFATINFKVWNMRQLDVIDALYFRLGFSMLVEWGHTMYFENSGEFVTNSGGGIDGFFDGDVTKEDIQYKINQRIIDTDGNYDGMLGVVTNFNYSFNQEGGWDCMIRLVGLGSVIETQKINSTYKLPAGAANTYKKSSEYIKKIEQQNQRLNAQIAAGKILDNDQKAYQKQLDDINASFPIKDFDTLYKAMASANTSNAPLAPADIETIRVLFSSTVITPYELDRNKPNEGFVYDLTNPSLAAYKVGDKIYPLLLNRKDSLGGLESGYRFPVQQDNVYTVKGKMLDDAAAIFVKEGFDPIRTNIAGTEIATFANVNSYKDLVLAIARIGNTFESRNLTPVNLWNLQNSKNDFVGGLEGCAGGVDIRYNYVSKKFTVKQVVLDRRLGGGWAFNPNIRIRRADGVDAFMRVKDVVDVLSKSSDFNNLSSLLWKLTRLGDESGEIIKKFSLESDGDVEVEGNYTTIQLTHTILAKGTVFATTDLALDPNQTGIVADIEIDLIITTELLGLLATLQSSPSDKIASLTKPDPNDPKYAPDYSNIKPSGDQVDEGSGLGSALEAMLTIIQYRGIEESLKNKGNIVLPTDISLITRDLLADLSNPPLGGVIDANGAIQFPQTNLKGADVFTDPFSLGLKGYSSTLLSRQIDKKDLETYKQSTNAGIPNPEDLLYSLTPNVDFKKLMISYALPQLKYTNSGISDEASIAAMLETPVYITMGYLLFFINNVCLLYDSTKNKKTKNIRPHFYIDFNPETNYCFTMPGQLSVDPTVCLIPFEGGQEDYNDIFRRMNIADPAAAITKGYFQKSSHDKVSTLIPNFRSIDSTGTYRAHTMNILLNTQYLLNTIKDTVEGNDHSNVYFKPFMDKVLADVNKALGNVNAFRLGYIDQSNTVAILDDQFVPPNEQESSLMKIKSDDGRAIIPIYGQQSVVRNLRFETNISTKMSSMIAIGARGNLQGLANSGSTQSNDASSLSWLNKGVEDRVIKQAEDAGKIPPTGSAQGLANQKTMAEKFNSHVKGLYEGKIVDKAQIQPAINYFVQSSTLTKALTPGSSATTPIPLNVDFTLDGISGINMGNVFLLPQDRVPISLRGDQVGDLVNVKWGYMVMGLNHSIQNNQWTTEVKGQMIKLRSDDSYTAAKVTPPGQAPAGVAAGGTFLSNRAARNLGYLNEAQFVATGAESDAAKAAAEAYLGSSLTDIQWNQLVSAVFAESGGTEKGKEDGYIMAVMLNGARKRNGLDAELSKQNRYQSITGTADDPGPSNNYINGPERYPGIAKRIYQAAVNVLPTVPKNFNAFTAMNPKAYKKGTNIGYRTQLLSTPGRVIVGGNLGTVFAAI